MTEAIGAQRAGLFSLLFGSEGGDHDPSRTAISDEVAAMVQDCAAIFKALGHEGRLLILCHLVGGEKSVSELENILDARQSVVSQQLARLRMEGMVTARRDGQMIFYSIKDPRVFRLLGALDTILAAAGDEQRDAGELPTA